MTKGCIKSRLIFDIRR